MREPSPNSLPRLLTAGIVGGVLVAVLAFSVRSCDWARRVQRASACKSRFDQEDPLRARILAFYALESAKVNR